MPYDIIPFILIIISFILIVIIMGRKISALKVLDIDTIAEEKEQQVMKSILETRLKRNLYNFEKFFLNIVRPLVEKLLFSIRNFYHTILDLEKKYKDEIKERKEKQLDPLERVEKYLKEAREKLQSEDAQLAEELFIKVIEVDNKNIEAYEGLAEYYGRIKDYKKAKEVIRYLLKLFQAEYKMDPSIEKKNRLASRYADLGEIDHNLENFSQTIKNYREALKLMPNNPKFLDLLLKISIIVKDKKLAKITLQQLKLADPENQKISDLQVEVNNL